MTTTTRRTRAAAFWRALKPWLLLRLRQSSTYAGLVVKLAGLAGFAVTDSVASHVAELLAVVVGAALVAYDQGGDAGRDDR